MFNPTPEYTARELASFERLATRAIRRVNSYTDASQVQARRELRAWRMRWATSLQRKAGATSAQTRQAWDNAVVAARADLNVLTATNTAFDTFEQLLEAPYTPTLRVPVLANAYDDAQVARGSDKRAGR